MIVALSIVFAALVGGVVFMLLDNWQRRDAPAPAAVKPEPPVYPPPPREPVVRPAPKREELEGSLWSGWARR